MTRVRNPGVGAGGDLETQGRYFQTRRRGKQLEGLVEVEKCLCLVKKGDLRAHFTGKDSQPPLNPPA